VSQESAAYEAGLAPGYIITQIGHDPVTSLADFRRVAARIQKGEVVRLTVAFYGPPARRGESPTEETRFIFFEAE